MSKFTVTLAIIFSLLLATEAVCETFTFTIPDPYLYHQEDEKKEPVLLYVTGTGNVKAFPEQVVISAYIYTKDKKASVAFEENQFKMSRLMSMLLSRGIPKKNIATESLSIDTIYKKDSTKVDYFSVYRSIKIFQDDLDVISPILDALIDAEIEDIGSIQFVVKNMEEKYREALQKAAEDCRNTAEMLATSMGARIVDLQSMSYDYGGYDYRVMERSVSGEMYGGLTDYSQMIVPREVTTTVNVYATYEIVYVGSGTF